MTAMLLPREAQRAAARLFNVQDAEMSVLCALAAGEPLTGDEAVQAFAAAVEFSDAYPSDDAALVREACSEWVAYNLTAP